MSGILQEWTAQFGEAAGVYVTEQHVCYWQGTRDHVQRTVSLHNWLGGTWPARLRSHMGEETTQEIETFVIALARRLAGWETEE